MVIEDKKYGINDVFEMIGEEHLVGDDNNKRKSNIIVDGFNVYKDSLRYMTFYQKGVKCACCGKAGTHFKLCGDKNTNRRHFNLYADDGTLITKDHIIPASKGGADKVSNMQTMCVNCNVAKGDSCSDIKVEYIVGHNVKNGKEVTFRSIERAAYSLACNYGKAISKNISNEKSVSIGINYTVKLIAAIENGASYCGFIWTKEMR